MTDQVSKSDGYVLGVDIGGTKVAAGVVDANGSISCQQRVPMVSASTATAGLQSVHSAIAAVLKTLSPSQEIRAIGICAPGPLDPASGVILNPPNVPCWRNFPLADEIAAVHRVPVKVDNDANSAALAETRWGAARGYSNVFYTCLGTGIGTGIILNGQIYHGRTGAAGEGGHISIDMHGPICSCGKPGCIEVFASGPAIARRTRTKLADVEKTSASQLLQMAQGNTESITAETVGKASAAGDPTAREVLRETVDILVLWLGNMVDLLDPEAIVIGGGAAAVLLPFFDEIRNTLPRYCVNPRAHEIALLPAHYGADSGIAGGAALCYDVARLDLQSD